MSISKRAIDTIFAQLKARPNGATYEELAKLTKYSLPTVKLAISSLNHSGSVSFTYSKPTIIKAIDSPPMAGQTLVIREPMPALEMDSKMVDSMTRDINSTKVNYGDELLVTLFTRIRSNSSEKNHSLMVFLINLSEAIRNHIANTELSIDDLNGDK